MRNGNPAAGVPSDHTTVPESRTSAGISTTTDRAADGASVRAHEPVAVRATTSKGPSETGESSASPDGDVTTRPRPPAIQTETSPSGRPETASRTETRTTVGAAAS